MRYGHCIILSDMHFYRVPLPLTRISLTYKLEEPTLTLGLQLVSNQTDIGREWSTGTNVVGLWTKSQKCDDEWLRCSRELVSVTVRSRGQVGKWQKQNRSHWYCLYSKLLSAIRRGVGTGLGDLHCITVPTTWYQRTMSDNMKNVFSFHAFP